VSRNAPFPRHLATVSRAALLAVALSGCTALQPSGSVAPVQLPDFECSILSAQLPTYDVFCPASATPGAYVLLALDDGAVRAEAVGLAQHLVRKGWGVVVTDAPEAESLDLVMQDASTAAPAAGCSVPARWSAIGWGKGASRLLRAVRAKRHLSAGALVLLDPSGEGELADGLCSEETERTKAFYCTPRVLVLESERGACGERSGERLFRGGLAGHARARAVVRGLGCCGPSQEASSACPGALGAGATPATAAAREHAVAWLTSFSGAPVSWRTPWPQPPAALRSYETVLQDFAPAASPQLNASAVFGLEHRGEGALQPSAGLRPELLLMRNTPRSVGAGPYGELAVSSRSPVVGTGGSVLLPVTGTLAVVPSGGWFGRGRAGEPWEAGVTGGVFVGRREFNPRSHVEFAFGVRADVRVPWRDPARAGLSVQVQFDLLNLGWIGFL
jgi:hypothetical protein